MHVYAQGNVVLTVGQDILSGSPLEIDLDKQVGSIEDAYLFLKENNFHITGHKIQKTGANTYRIDEATLTTCDGASPRFSRSVRGSSSGSCRRPEPAAEGARS